MKREPNPIDKHVGQRVRMRRMMLSMSQEKLGEALGLTFQQVQKYEKGTNRIGSSRLQQIADILGAKPAFFFDGAPTANSNGSSDTPSADLEAVQAFMASTDGIEIARAWPAITNPELRHSLKGTIKAAAGIA